MKVWIDVEYKTHAQYVRCTWNIHSIDTMNSFINRGDELKWCSQLYALFPFWVKEILVVFLLGCVGMLTSLDNTQQDNTQCSSQWILNQFHLSGIPGVHLSISRWTKSILIFMHYLNKSHLINIFYFDHLKLAILVAMIDMQYAYACIQVWNELLMYCLFQIASILNFIIIKKIYDLWSLLIDFLHLIFFPIHNPFDPHNIVVEFDVHLLSSNSLDKWNPDSQWIETVSPIS